MIHLSSEAIRRRQRPAQCTAIQAIDNLGNAFRLNYHQCTLASYHPGMHRCWCECCFDDHGELWVQPRLPDANDDTDYPGPGWRGLPRGS